MKLFVVLALVLTSCSTTKTSAPSQDWGKVEGPIRTEWNRGRKMTLLEDVKYVAPDGQVWIASKGDQIDGASIPKPFWSVLGGPYEGLYRDASVFHDVACVRRNRPWQSVHQMFYTAMRSSGVPEQKAKLMYAAVHRFGPRWKVVDNQLVSTPLAAKREPTATDVQKIDRWIKNNDPSVEAIEVSQEIPGNPTR